MSDSQLFHIDTIVIGGKAIAFEDSTGVLNGAAGFENTAVPSASGDDFTNRKRVARTLACKIQFGNKVNPEDFAKISEEQITLRDTVAGRRALLPKNSFASMGAIGGGSVDVTFNVLAKPQWI